MRRLVACLSLLALAPVARAGICVTPSGTITSSPTADPTVRSFTGDVYPFGKIDGALQLQVDPVTGHFTGPFIFGAPGGAVYGTVDGQFVDGAQYVETLTIAGGTGRYAGTTGAIQVFGGVDARTGTGTDMILGGQVCRR